MLLFKVYTPSACVNSLNRSSLMLQIIRHFTNVLKFFLQIQDSLPLHNSAVLVLANGTTSFSIG